MPCSTLRHWVSLYGETPFRQELQEHSHLDEYATQRERERERGVGGLKFPPTEQGGGHTKTKGGISSERKLVTPEMFVDLSQITERHKCPAGDMLLRVCDKRWEICSKSRLYKVHIHHLVCY